jgi:tripartite-type tricarboxylate transporter receptor subunit TctC
MRLSMRFSSRFRAITAFACVPALALVTAACAGAGGDSGGGAAGWKPTRPVTFLVPGSPGGGGDLLFRNLQQFMTKKYPDVKTEVVNRPGAGTAVAYTELKGENGNPHILSLLFSGLITLPIDQKVAYSWTDFTPIGITELDTQFLVTKSGSPGEDFNGYVDQARQKGAMNVGVAGASSRSDISSKQVADKIGVKYNPVYLQSGGDIMRALLAGDIDIASLSSQEFIGQLKAGDVTAQLTLSDKVVPIAPLDKIPTAKDVLGITPDGVDFKGVAGAGGLSPAEKAYWQDVIKQWAASDIYDDHIKTSLLLKNVLLADDATTYMKTFEDNYQATK